jgi:hypothetical protein
LDVDAFREDLLIAKTRQTELIQKLGKRSRPSTSAPLSPASTREVARGDGW